MIEKLINSHCYYPLTKGEYFIYDDAKNDKPSFVSKDQIWNLNIVNNLGAIVHFIQNDGCIMTQNELKKCDWVCFTNDTIIFIEAKNVKRKGRRKKQRNDAVEKFKVSISYYFKSYPEIKTMKLIVIMNFKSYSGITQASNKAKAFYFKNAFNAEYIETNFLEFK